jgi:hypothetical protein
MLVCSQARLSVLLIVVVFSANLVLGIETTSDIGPVNAGAKSAVPSLPKCIDDEKEIEKIKSTIKANVKTKFKYNGYRAALHSESESDLLARLAYSETVAANCPDLNTKIAPLIVAAITNRIRFRKGDVRSVVFERDQFASSLNIYAESRYQDFLCPKDVALWTMISAKAKSSMGNQSEVNDFLSDDTVNYFLYKHSPKWTKEPWKLNEDKTKIELPIQNCIRFFHNPQWR